MLRRIFGKAKKNNNRRKKKTFLSWNATISVRSSSFYSTILCREVATQYKHYILKKDYMVIKNNECIATRLKWLQSDVFYLADTTCRPGLCRKHTATTGLGLLNRYPAQPTRGITRAETKTSPPRLPPHHLNYHRIDCYATSHFN